MNRSQRLSTLVLSLLVSFGTVASADISESKQISCKLTGASQCDTDAECLGVTLDQINLSENLRIDLENAELTAATDDRTSQIRSIDKLESVVVLHGHQDPRGWTIVIDRKTGFLSAALAESEGAFVITGSCTPD